MEGQIFGRWTVIRYSGVRYIGKDQQERDYYLCRCSCGVERSVAGPSLLNGISQSCGCWNRERSIEANTTHGQSSSSIRTPEYKAWQAMKDRCTNPNNSRYEAYGGRGITFCDEWKDFTKFFEDMGSRPSDGHTLERRNNDLGYSKDNCYWATQQEQAVNKRNTLFIGDIPLATLAKQYDIPKNTLRFRIIHGWSVEDALNTPVRPKRPHGSGRAPR